MFDYIVVERSGPGGRVYRVTTHRERLFGDIVIRYFPNFLEAAQYAETLNNPGGDIQPNHERT